MMHVCRLLCGGTLAEALERKTRLPEPALWIVAKRVLLGLRNLHAAGLGHRDLKPGNVGLTGVVGDYATTVIFDWGSAQPLKGALFREAFPASMRRWQLAHHARCKSVDGQYIECNARRANLVMAAATFHRNSACTLLFSPGMILSLLFCASA